MCVRHSFDRHGHGARDRAGYGGSDLRLQSTSSRDVEPEHLEGRVEYVQRIERHVENRHTGEEARNGLLPWSALGVTPVECVRVKKVGSGCLLHQSVAHWGARSVSTFVGDRSRGRNDLRQGGITGIRRPRHLRWSHRRSRSRNRTETSLRKREVGHFQRLHLRLITNWIQAINPSCWPIKERPRPLNNSSIPETYIDNDELPQYHTRSMYLQRLSSAFPEDGVAGALRESTFHLKIHHHHPEPHLDTGHSLYRSKYLEVMTSECVCYSPLKLADDFMTSYFEPHCLAIRTIKV